MQERNARLQARMKRFALDVIALVEALPQSRTTDVIGRQLLRSSTSVGANYRAACRAKSTADFIAKLKIVEEEADESMYWLELLLDSGAASDKHINPLLTECNELVAICVSSLRTARHNRA